MQFRIECTGRRSISRDLEIFENSSKKLSQQRNPNRRGIWNSKRESVVYHVSANCKCEVRIHQNRNTEIQKYRNTEIHKYTDTQIQKNTNAQIHESLLFNKPPVTF